MKRRDVIVGAAAVAAVAMVPKVVEAATDDSDTILRFELEMHKDALGEYITLAKVYKYRGHEYRLTSLFEEDKNDVSLFEMHARVLSKRRIDSWVDDKIMYLPSFHISSTKTVDRIVAGWMANS